MRHKPAAHRVPTESTEQGRDAAGERLAWAARQVVWDTSSQRHLHWQQPRLQLDPTRRPTDSANGTNGAQRLRMKAAQNYVTDKYGFEECQNSWKEIAGDTSGTKLVYDDIFAMKMERWTMALCQKYKIMHEPV